MLFNNRGEPELHGSTFTEVGRSGGYNTGFFASAPLSVSARDGVEELCNKLHRFDPRPSSTKTFGMN